jgi:hypothetical protein
LAALDEAWVTVFRADAATPASIAPGKTSAAVRALVVGVVVLIVVAVDQAGWTWTMRTVQTKFTGLQTRCVSREGGRAFRPNLELPQEPREERVSSLSREIPSSWIFVNYGIGQYTLPLSGNLVLVRGYRVLRHLRLLGQTPGHRHSGMEPVVWTHHIEIERHSFAGIHSEDVLRRQNLPRKVGE